MSVPFTASFVVLLLAATSRAARAGGGDEHSHASHSASADGPTDADVGNWTVSHCIMVQFAMDITINLSNHTDLNTTSYELTVPPNAVVDQAMSACGREDEKMVLTWSDVSRNGTNLSRNMTIEFAKSNQSDNSETVYGVRRLYGRIELAHFEDVKKNETRTVVSSIDIDTNEMEKVRFPTPLNYSYLCADAGKFDIDTHLHYSYPGSPSSGTDLKNSTTISARHVRFDAFRSVNSTVVGYRTPVDCAYEPNDIVPIIVGVALAAMVVIILVAYMVGRRRRQRGYESV